VKSHDVKRGRGFSLIEVLIAVVVLSLGLLGLGMVFPVVVRQQRQAQDSIQGISAMRSAVEYLRSRSDLLTNPTSPPSTNTNKLWGVAVAFAGKSVTAGFDLWPVPDQSPTSNFSLMTNDGTMRVAISSSEAATLRVGERLYPSPFDTPSGPQMVWDFSVRKAGTDRYQIALFVRRIDSGIQLPPASGSKRFTISNVLTGIGVNSAQRRSPVAVFSQGARKGMPSGTGADERGTPFYATLRTILPTGVRSFAGPGIPDTETRRWLKVSAADASLLSLARQVGQKLIDNRGVVHTVQRVPEGDDYKEWVVLDQPMSPDLFTDISKPDNKRPVNFVFTPQVPAAAGVYTFNVDPS